MLHYTADFFLSHMGRNQGTDAATAGKSGTDSQSGQQLPPYKLPNTRGFPLPLMSAPVAGVRLYTGDLARPADGL